MSVSVGNVPKTSTAHTGRALYSEPVAGRQLGAKPQKILAKILQSESRRGMLVRVPSGPLVSIVIPTETWLQFLDRTTGTTTDRLSQTVPTDSVPTLGCRRRLGRFGSKERGGCCRSQRRVVVPLVNPLRDSPRSKQPQESHIFVTGD